jgi:hypothetical protein
MEDIQAVPSYLPPTCHLAELKHQETLRIRFEQSTRFKRNLHEHRPAGGAFSAVTQAKSQKSQPETNALPSPCASPAQRTRKKADPQQVQKKLSIAL